MLGCGGAEVEFGLYSVRGQVKVIGQTTAIRARINYGPATWLDKCASPQLFVTLLALKHSHQCP